MTLQDCLASPLAVASSSISATTSIPTISKTRLTVPGTGQGTLLAILAAVRHGTAGTPTTGALHVRGRSNGGLRGITVIPLMWSPSMKNLMKRLVSEDRGQDVIEYALLAAGISIILIPTVPAIGNALNAVYGNINTQVGLLPQ
jgi:Flp pilus assembly pilin Flp